MTPLDAIAGLLGLALIAYLLLALIDPERF